MTPAELDQRLARTGKAAVGLCRRAVGKGLNVLAKLQQARAPIGKNRRIQGRLIVGGATRKSIRARLLPSRQGIAEGKSGIDVKTRPGASGAPQAHLVAAGTDVRFTGFKGVYIRRRIHDHKRTKHKIAYRGKVNPNRFILDAAESAQSAVSQAMATSLQAGIERELIRQG